MGVSTTKTKKKSPKKKTTSKKTTPKKTSAKQAPPKDKKTMAEIGRLGGLARAGTKNKDTQIKEAAQKLYEDGVYAGTRGLFNAQMHLAIGKYVVLYFMGSKVQDEETLDWYMDIRWQIENEGEDSIDEEELKRYKMFALVTLHQPDNAAIKDMLDRSFGKAKERVEVSGEIGGMKALADAIDRASMIRLAIANDQKEQVLEQRQTIIDTTPEEKEPEKGTEKLKISKKSPIYLSAMNLAGLKKEALKHGIKVTGNEDKNQLINLITKEL